VLQVGVPLTTPLFTNNINCPLLAPELQQMNTTHKSGSRFIKLLTERIGAWQSTTNLDRTVSADWTLQVTGQGIIAAGDASMSSIMRLS